MLSAQTIIEEFYPIDTPLRELLLSHSTQVCQKALAIAQGPAAATLKIDLEEVKLGAMLHDIGIGSCHAPSIHCSGTRPYICHGIVGGEMLRNWGHSHGIDMESYARICERHTGAGITAQEVQEQALPIPVCDYLPETNEEKLICLADKFYSKSNPNVELSLAAVRQSMSRFGVASLSRFDALCKLFGLSV